MKFLLLVLCTLFVLVSPSWSQSYPSPVGYVNDFASLYSSSFRTSLNTQLQQLDTNSSIQFVVVTIKSLEGVSIEEYSLNLFEQWAVGQKGKDNGLLLLISQDDRKLRFEVGYGLEGTITDGTAGSIIRNEITPAFKNGDYEAGTQAGVNRVFQLLGQSASATPSPPASPNLPFSPDTLPFIFIFLVYFISYMARTREFLAGGIVGFLVGLIFITAIWGIALGLIGLILDFILSRNYKNRHSLGLPTDFWRSTGGFRSGGGWGSGGGGGFSGGGGRSGGGGASGGW